MKFKPWIARWYAINQRCNDKKWHGYKNYGGRGIENFISQNELKILWERDKAESMERPTIDRIDINGDYTFENCRFIENQINAAIRRFRDLCPRGHLYEGDNLYLNTSKGWKNRVCRICAKLSRQKYINKLISMGLNRHSTLRKVT